MTGTFMFNGNPPFAGSVTPTLSTDANGNQDLTANVTTMPQFGQDVVQRIYSGDDNFAGPLAVTSIKVIVPDFNFTAATPSMTINAGQTATSL